MKYDYQLGFDTRYGIHMYGAPDVATNRHTFEYQQKAQYNKEWSSVIGVRTEVEAAYAANTARYSVGDVAKNDSQSFFPKDNYLQFKSDTYRLRLGYQQVVWGEAFGSYYADIVNPKDFREVGLGDLSRNRLASPMVNMQWIYSATSLQLLYIPKATYNLLPSAGSDFNSFKQMAGLPASFTVQRTPNNVQTRGEAGARYTQQISGLDLSLFYLNYYDRMPVYSLQAGALPTDVIAVPEYKPLQTGGLTATFDLSGFLVRSEVLQHFNRELNTTTDAGGISSEKTNEFIYVIGLDLPPLDKWQVGLQYSESRLKKGTWLGRENSQSVASLRIAKTFANNTSLEVLMTDFTLDSSTLTQFQAVLPISNRSEFLVGIDKFDGKLTSELGRYRDASRAWLMFKLFLQE
ncbi:MAG: DUF1302 family protein [Pseudobdellovibrio sp.]